MFLNHIRSQNTGVTRVVLFAREKNLTCKNVNYQQKKNIDAPVSPVIWPYFTTATNCDERSLLPGHVLFLHSIDVCYKINIKKTL